MLTFRKHHQALAVFGAYYLQKPAKVILAFCPGHLLRQLCNALWYNVTLSQRYRGQIYYWHYWHRYMNVWIQYLLSLVLHYCATIVAADFFLVTAHQFGEILTHPSVRSSFNSGIFFSCELHTYMYGSLTCMNIQFLYTLQETDAASTSTATSPISILVLFFHI